MSSTIYEFRRTSAENLWEFQNKFMTELENNAVELETVYNHITKTDSAEVLLLVCEKYYFRNGSMASLTLQCISENNEQTVTVIGNGGGEGIWNISYGANANFAKKAAKILANMGFVQ